MVSLPADRDSSRHIGYVALTFDDGPTPATTPALLEALAEAGARATMFNVGRNVEAHPELARAQVEGGMWVANHSWSHPHMLTLDEAEQDAEIARTQRVMSEVIGITPDLFRPPYLETDAGLRTVQERHGLSEILTDVDSVDWDGVSAEAIVESARRLRDGDVLLMHDWPPSTVEAIPRIVAELTGRGLRTGPISARTGRAIAPASVDVRRAGLVAGFTPVPGGEAVSK